MIVTDHFIFMHVPKTGGSFVRNILKNELFNWNTREVGHHHSGVRDIKPKDRRKPIIGFVRDPVAYYRSWYNFWMSQDLELHKKSIFALVSDCKLYGFEATIRNLLEGEQYGNIKPIRIYGDERFNIISMMRKADIGFYTWSFLYTFGVYDIHLGRTEELAEDLVRLLEFTGAPINKKHYEFIKDQPPANESEHDYVGEHLPSELKQLIHEKEKFIYNYAYRCAL